MGPNHSDSDSYCYASKRFFFWPVSHWSDYLFYTEKIELKFSKPQQKPAGVDHSRLITVV